MSRAPLSNIEIEDVHVVYQSINALQGVSLSIQHGDFFIVIGPSGSGKSTLLKLICGLETATVGRVSFSGTPLNSETAANLQVVMVWQSLALFPFMDVQGNVSFGLTIRGVPKAERQKRVSAMLERLDLKGYENRKIHELSGGEQQRVALARACVVEPKVLLLDEPFGALDVHLRKELAKQLSELHRSMGMTFVMVTHDHSEALGLGSRIAVLNRGKIEQIGLADDIRLRPSTEFVSRFVGNRNVLDGSVLHKDGATIRVLTPLGEFTGQVAPWTKTAIEVGQRVVYVIDAADVRLGEVDVNQIVGVVHGSSFIGSLEVVQIAVESFGIFLCEVYRRERAAGASVSQAVRATWSASAAFILPVA